MFKINVFYGMNYCRPKTIFWFVFIISIFIRISSESFNAITYAIDSQYAFKKKKKKKTLQSMQQLQMSDIRSTTTIKMLSKQSV